MARANWRSPFDVFGPLFGTVPGIWPFAWQLLPIAVVPRAWRREVRFGNSAREMDTAIVVSLASVAIYVLLSWCHTHEMAVPS